MRSVPAAAVTILLAWIYPSCGLYFHIGETEKKCFIEEIPDETMVIGKLAAEPEASQQAALTAARCNEGAASDKAGWADYSDSDETMTFPLSMTFASLSNVAANCTTHKFHPIYS